MSALDQLRARLGDRYTIERELGRGGMGAVYLARDVRLDRLVALKVLPTEYAVMPTLRDRFLRETRMAASFSHPNIVPVYAVEEADDLLAYVMSYVEGESLAERVKRAGALPVREAVRLLQDVGYALAYAHGRGVVHRDIKPDNIMIERATGRALVMDFGVARAIAASAPATGEGLTRIGEIVGTPEYMSPEQASGDEVDGRSDLYSLGLTAYFALSARSIMQAESTGKMLAKQITETPPPLREIRRDVPAKLAEAVERCVQKEPGARFDKAENLVEALEEAQLAAPEIPLPVRLFAQEIGSLSMVLLFGGFFLAVLLRESYKTGFDNLDVLLPVLGLSGVLMTRVLQTLSEARRLAFNGFTAGSVHRGLSAVVAERAERRADLHGDDRTRNARRRTLYVATFMLVVAIALFVGSLQFRTRYANGYSMSIPGVILIFSATIMSGVSLVLLLRSPFRMPIGERLFRLMWLGPVGRAFYGMAGRGMSPAKQATSGPSIVPGMARAEVRPKPVAPDDRVTRLESRVDALEKWRGSASFPPPPPGPRQP